MAEPDLHLAGVRFRNAGKIYYFHSAGIRLEPGEYVVVESARGPEVGKVVIGTGQVVVNELGNEELRPILRLATEDDIRRADRLRRRAEEEVLPEARAIAREAGFPARIDAADFTLDGRRLTLSFTSEERVDYRDFLRRIGDRFGARVDMRQMGARDRAKQAGGYGICGRELCCANWLTTFPSISIRMAKEQELPLNPQKISGLCGRLLCCLSYEEEGYRAMRQRLPRVGQRCSTPTGEGRVVAVNILKRQVTLLVDGKRVEVGDRDLGTVVRWDASSRSAEPPPSMTRAEGVAAGLIEAIEAEEEPPGPWDEDAPASRGYGRISAPAPRRSPPPPGEPKAGTAPPPARGPGRGRGHPDAAPRRGSEPRPQRPQPLSPPSIEGAKTRTFRRSGEGAGPGGTPPDPVEGGARRRRRRGGRPPGDTPGPPPA
jgi:cell fate regulator YaaT (PSP1 superfamily)